jgi:transposase
MARTGQVRRISTEQVDTGFSRVEGHVNRLKTIKRQMYGRAGFVLLWARVLNAI